MEKRIPRRRFKEFIGSGPWEKKKLGEILRTDSFRSYIKKPQFNGEHIVIQQGNDPVAGYADGDPYLDYEKVVLFGDHTLSLYKPKVPFFISTDGLKIIYGSNNMDSNFILYTLELYKPKNEGYKRYYSILKDKEVYISKNLAEQEKIGNFFQKLDRLIEINREKLDKLKASKSAYLAEMFPREGEDRPRRRFKGFTGAWEEKKLGEVSIIKGRLGWKSLKKEEYIQSGPSMIAGKHIRNGVIDWDNVDHIPEWRYYESPEIMLKNGDVIFSKDGTLGNPALIHDLNVLATINSTMMLVRTNETINSLFFYYVLLTERFASLIKMKVSGSSVPHLFQADMNEFKFFIPSLSEQEKIGDFFKKLDQQIEVQEEKLEKLEKMKKAYLAEIFV